MSLKLETIKLDWKLVGNAHIIDFLSKSVKKDDLSGAYIFYGPDNLGKTTLANSFAQIVLCEEKGGILPCGKCASCRKFLVKSGREEEEKEKINFGGIHGDFHLVKKEKDKKNISIEQIRELIRKLNMSSFLSSYKVGIIKHADSLSIEAANALLKTLEEPKDKVIIILIASDLDSIPPTIVSRSKNLRFNPVCQDEIYDYLVEERKASRSAAKNFSRLSLGRPALAVKFLEDEEFYNNYLGRTNAFLNFFGEDVNGRFKTIEELMGANNSGQEAVGLAARIIEIWLGLLRDLILLEFNRADLIQHEAVLKEMERVKGKISLASLLNLTDILKQSNKYLKANVSPKLVLENIAINF